MNPAEDLKKKFTTGDPVGANQNPIPTEDIHSQETPVNQPGNVGPSNEPTETNDAISRYQKYVEGIQRPDLSSLLTGYDQQTKQAGQDVQKAESNRKWAALADLGNLVGGYIGARGGANVNVNPTNNEGVYNQAINKLSNTYRQFQAGRPDLVAKLVLQKYNEQMQTAGGLYKGAVLSDKEKQDQFNQDYKLADLQWKIKNGTATRQEKEKYDAEMAGYRTKMANIATINAYTNRGRLTEEQGKNYTRIGNYDIPNNELTNIAGGAYQAAGSPEITYSTLSGTTTRPLKDPKELLTYLVEHSNDPAISKYLDSVLGGKSNQPSKKSSNDVNWRKHNATPQTNTPADNDINGTLVNQ